MNKEDMSWAFEFATVLPRLYHVTSSLFATTGDDDLPAAVRMIDRMRRVASDVVVGACWDGAVRCGLMVRVSWAADGRAREAEQVHEHVNRASAADTDKGSSAAPLFMVGMTVATPRGLVRFTFMEEAAGHVTLGKFLTTHRSSAHAAAKAVFDAVMWLWLQTGTMHCHFHPNDFLIRLDKNSHCVHACIVNFSTAAVMRDDLTWWPHPHRSRKLA
jgi:hypothetical protein